MIRTEKVEDKITLYPIAQASSSETTGGNLVTIQ